MELFARRYCSIKNYCFKNRLDVYWKTKICSGVLLSSWVIARRRDAL